MKLSCRLETIAKMVLKDSRVADIGTDHGLVPIFLSENKISEYIICSDISKSSLMKSEHILVDYPNIHPRLGDGLNVIKKDEVDEVIIAGMGGVLISNILEENIEIVKNLKGIILQPMQASNFLRKYLYEKYTILEEKVVYEDDRFFEIIKVVYTGEKTIVDEIFYSIPKISYKRKDKQTIDLIKFKMQTNKKIINELSDSEASNDKKIKLQKEIDDLERLL